MRDSTTSDLDQVSLGELVAMASAAPVLDARTEALLAGRAAAGDTEALEKLVRMTLRFAIDEAIRNRGLGSPQRDLVRKGVQTLVEAARRYDPARHGSFARFARGEVRRALSAKVSTN